MTCTCNWRRWIRPLLVVIYIISILVSVSFGVWELQKLKWLSMKFPKVAVYVDTCKDCYEAFVLYNFMILMRNYVQIQSPRVMLHLETKHQRLPFLCCCPPWARGEMVNCMCRWGMLQYAVIRLVTTLTTMVCETAGVYKEGNLSVDNAWTYLFIVNNFSEFFAVYCLWLFYKMLKEELRGLKPVGKFVCIKMVVWLSLLQGVIIAVLLKVGIISETLTKEWQNPEATAIGLQDFITSIGMLVAAFGNNYFFPYDPYIKEGEEGSCFNSFLAMFDVSDIMHDIMEEMRCFEGTRHNTKRDVVLKTQSIPNTQVGLPHHHTMKVLQAQRHPFPRASIGALDTNTPQNAVVAFHLGEHDRIDIPEEKGPPDVSGK
ncbi:transmembrane protein 184C-like isoform X2 [Microtus pennsylvanicus]|uniref:transmembrane protein 184C-like isoform X2 n=1 Tax=Microtus pennsylvanicus TaxID=10058 RepID=UPI003F6CFD33